MRVFHTFLMGGASAAAIVAMPATASAQVADADPQAAAENVGNAEIIVTANKREQNLNDVGMAIDVIGGEALKARQITSLGLVDKG